MVKFLRNQEAFRWLCRTYGGKTLGGYVDRANINYANKTVGYLWICTNKKKEVRRFLVTFRPKGIAGFTIKGIGPVTLMGESELKYQFKYRWDRLVIFQNPEDVLLYIFPNYKVREYLQTAENVDSRNEFIHAPAENDKGYNIPINLAINFNKWYNGEIQI